jgi:hypothetical protein
MEWRGVERFDLGVVSFLEVLGLGQRWILVFGWKWSMEVAVMQGWVKRQKRIWRTWVQEGVYGVVVMEGDSLV